MSDRYCPKCQKALPSDASYCPFCGTPITDGKNNTESPTLKFVLATVGSVFVMTGIISLILLQNRKLTNSTDFGNKQTTAPTPQPTAHKPQVAPMTVAVRPGTVVSSSVSVRAARTPSSSMLSTATKGQNLAVLSEMDGLYGVLMVNNTVGWVPKEAIQLMDYNTDVALATPVPGTPASAEVAANTSGLSEKQRQILREAFTYMGVPYKRGGASRSGIDGENFVKRVFTTVGVSLPRHAGDQLTVGRTIDDTGKLLAGDRLYFAMKGGTTITHTGIYLSEGLFIHASSNYGRVDVDPLFKTNYINKLVAIRRD